MAEGATQLDEDYVTKAELAEAISLINENVDNKFNQLLETMVNLFTQTRSRNSPHVSSSPPLEPVSLALNNPAASIENNVYLHPSVANVRQLEADEAAEEILRYIAENKDDTIPDRRSKRKDSGRRDSFMAKVSAYGTEAGAYTHPMIYRQQPSFDHIKLLKANIWSVVRFVKNVDEYEAANNTLLPMATLINEIIRKRIIAKSSVITESNFYKIDREVLLEDIRKMVQPKNLNEVVTLLSKIDFPQADKFKPSEDIDFEEFYSCYLVYKEKFMDYYKFMTTDNKPYQEEKKGSKAFYKVSSGSVLATFLSKIPFKYGYVIFGKLGVTKFGTFDEFLQLFSKEVHKHSKIAENYVEVKQALNSSKLYGLDQERLREDVRDTKQRTPFPDRKHSVSNILSNGIDPADDDYREDEYLSPLDTRHVTDDNAKTRSGVVPDEDDDDDDDPEYSQLDLLDTKPVFQAIQPTHILKKPSLSPNSVPPKSLPTGCFRLLLTGKCEFANCKYSHKRDELVLTCQKMMQDLGKSQYAKSS
jgi:hypothetical protein